MVRGKNKVDECVHRADGGFFGKEGAMIFWGTEDFRENIWELVEKMK
jgi:hypothetical protein